jgi:hypothetical protein
MSRPLRVEYSGAIYHVMCRGNRRERIFRGQADYQLMLKRWHLPGLPQQSGLRSFTGASDT